MLAASHTHLVCLDAQHLCHAHAQLLTLDHRRYKAGHLRNAHAVCHIPQRIAPAICLTAPRGPPCPSANASSLFHFSSIFGMAASKPRPGFNANSQQIQGVRHSLAQSLFAGAGSYSSVTNLAGKSPKRTGMPIKNPLPSRTNLAAQCCLAR